MAVSCTIKKKNPLNFCPISLLPFTAELSESCFYPQHLHSLSSCLLAPEPTLTRILFLPLQRPHPSHQCSRYYYIQQSVSLVLILLTYEQLLTIITWSFWQGFVHVISKTPHMPGFLVSWHFCWFLLISQLLNIGVPKICSLDTSLFCLHNLPGYLIPIFSTWVTLYLYLQTRLLPELQSPISNCLLRCLMCLSNLTCPKWISFPMTLSLSQSTTSPSVAQAKYLEVLFDSSFSLTTYIQSISKLLLHYFLLVSNHCSHASKPPSSLTWVVKRQLPNCSLCFASRISQVVRQISSFPRLPVSLRIKAKIATVFIKP